ncbi:MAG: biotin/lipoyl-containing protein, partial [Candidatus Margulisiibacteriota bacterium]
MAKDIIVPAAGESVTEADISSWMKADGAFVKMDDEIVELETDKASLPLAAPVSGVLKILVKAGTTVKVGDVIGVIDEKAGGAAPAPTATQPTEKTDSYAKGHPSPAPAKAMAEKGVSSQDLKGSGK